MSSIAMVKLRKRESGRGYESYEITVPKEMLEKLQWSVGDRLIVKIVEHENKKALLIYKAE